MATAKKNPKKKITFEISEAEIKRIDAHIKKSEAENAALAASPSKNNSDLCRVFGTVEPIIGTVLIVLSFKPKWKKAVKIFLDAMNTNCATGAGEEEE